MSSPVIIIGGGISGTAAAWELARHGIGVTLIERGELASMASGWTLAGVRQSGRHPAELPLAQAAVRRWETLAEELGTDVEYRQGGNLRLALSNDDVPAMRQVVSDGIAAGIEMRYLSSIDEIHAIAPALTDDLAGASLCPTDGHANPQKVVLAFAGAAKRAGATILTGTSVDALIVEHDRATGVRTSAGRIEGDRVIVAAGVYTPKLLGPLGIDLPFDIVHVPGVQTVPTAPLLDQVLGIPAGGFAARQQADGRFRLTGSSIPWAESWHDEDNIRPTAGQMRDTIAWATRLIPAVADLRIAQVWGGLIDKTPDALPVIERTPEIEGLIVAAGFSGHGFCLGPVTGEILADLAVEGVTSQPIGPFNRARLDRMATGEAATLHG